MEHGAKDVITQGNKILERSDVEDLNKKSDWAVLKRPSKRILEEGRRGGAPLTDISLEIL